MIDSLLVPDLCLDASNEIGELCVKLDNLAVADLQAIMTSKFQVKTLVYLQDIDFDRGVAVFKPAPRQVGSLR